MPAPIEDYALLGDTETAALVSKEGSVDWLALPRFDSGACFAALLGTEENGRWSIRPAGEIRKTTRRYRAGLVLETVWETDDGTVAVIDGMPLRDERPNLIRIVEGRSGTVPMHLDLTVRFDYGSIVPWVRNIEGRWHAVAGPDALVLTTPVALRGENKHTVADFSVGPGDRLPFELQWHPSHHPMPEAVDPFKAMARTEHQWNEWIDRCTYKGPWEDALRSSLVVLKGLTYHPTGGIVAAATTSLPESIGGGRNWDYRNCWLRDATFTLLTLLECGYTEEAQRWRDWLLRAVAGDPASLQIMYGPAGERRLDEQELPWLPGYEGSRPVRIGNGASSQLQLDVWGEVLDALYSGRRAGLAASHDAWQLERALLDHLEGAWKDPDEGIWEVRGPRRQFTHSKVMAWVAFDRAVRSVESFGLDGPADRWRALRDEVHADVCANGVDERGAFVQSYGSTDLDASLLLVPLTGFLPPRDPRVRATVDAIATELTDESGFVWRYEPKVEVDGLGGKEGAFLLCTFWLVDCLAMTGRVEQATALFERLLALRNDVGLLSEQYDPVAGRMLGNFPQAFSHVALVDSATHLRDSRGGALRRRTE
ncbi:MAG TPA: glycoside hydrolase family 15 protein [Acidimicrobiales bacterium]|nr:glycoside hydrolase family 15 protein [Acidimicrobiales bacterium]